MFQMDQGFWFLDYILVLTTFRSKWEKDLIPSKLCWILVTVGSY